MHNHLQMASLIYYYINNASWRMILELQMGTAIADASFLKKSSLISAVVHE